jgi:hypothetical protein
MGTSASNGGPKGTPSLLPAWYDPTSMDDVESVGEDGEIDGKSDLVEDTSESLPEEGISAVPAKEADDIKPPVSWSGAKGALTRLSNTRGSSSMVKAGKSYLNSLGGSKNATKAAKQGRLVGSRYANFLGSVSSGGINSALQKFGLDQLIGSSSEEICSAIVNAIAPAGSTNDEAVAREALVLTMQDLYERLEAEGDDFANISSLSSEQVKETLIEFISNYIFVKWMYELGNSIERGNISESEAIDLERQINDLIHAETLIRCKDITIETYDLNNQTTEKVIEEIFLIAYSTLE